MCLCVVCVLQGLDLGPYVSWLITTLLLSYVLVSLLTFYLEIIFPYVAQASLEHSRAQTGPELVISLLPFKYLKLEVFNTRPNIKKGSEIIFYYLSELVLLFLCD